VNALADEKVGDYVNEQFVAAHQKVGTFQKAGANKQGGNVATYFCLPDQTVLHVIPGPVDANVFLREARWAVSTYESALMEVGNDTQELKDYLRAAHAQRYLTEHRSDRISQKGGRQAAVARREVAARQARAAAAPEPPAQLNDRMPRLMPDGVSPLGQGHWLMWSEPLPRIGNVYKTVWTDILREPLTDLPVIVR
jgi:hypothetical protein